MEKLVALLIIFVSVFFLGVLVSAIVAIPVMWLWNDLNTIFHLPSITWFQAWELSFLTGLLFKPTSTTSTSK